MENFKWDKTIDFSKPENVERLLKENQEFMDSKFLKPTQEKLKEYETKVNEYQEKELFTGFNEKQIKIAKSLMTSEYKDFSKSDALNKIKTDYQEIFNPNLSTKEIIKEEPKKDIFNPKDLVKMHELADKNNINNIREKAKINGLTDKKELTELIRATFEEIK